MAITGTSAASASGLRTWEDMNRRNTNSNSLGKTEFLNILVAQLANQDPLDPVSDTEFISQLAQFSALEQMQSLNTAFAASQARSLIGKYVLIDDEGGQGENAFYGRVDGVIRQNGIDYLLIEDLLYDLDSVVGVIDSPVNSDLDGESISHSANHIRNKY